MKVLILVIGNTILIVNIIGANLEITRCSENRESLGSIESSLDSSQLPVTSTVKANKKIKEHA